MSTLMSLLTLLSCLLTCHGLHGTATNSVSQRQELASGALQVARQIASAGVPTRFITFCHGRDGSTELALTLAHLTDSPQHVLDTELFGQYPTQIDHFGNATADSDKLPVRLMATFFDKQQQSYPSARLLGFKWKNWHYQNNPFLAAWESVAAQGIRVIWLHRNPLDVMISMARHAATNNSLTSHCGARDTVCVRAHMSVRVNLNATSLVYELEENRRVADVLPSGLFHAFGVQYIRVAFEDLMAGSPDSYHTEPNEALAVATWNHVLSFLGQPTVDGYQRVATAINRTGHAPTHPPSQCDALSNADAVRDALRGTRHEGLLSC